MSKHDFYLPGPENPMTSDPMHNFTRLVAREIAKAFSDGFKAGAGAERSEAIRMAIRKAEAFDKIVAIAERQIVPGWLVDAIKEATP
jgi:UDP-N-acetylmuramyl tripeptide synthase